MRKWLMAAVLLSGCGFVDYDKTPAGKFSGTLFVMWVGESEGGLGDGRFVFVPSADPLTFTRASADGTTQIIRPEMMYTDGGSIPAIAQAFKGFSPWGYAPAYMVHDWLFVAKKCLNDGMANEAQQVVAGMSFHDSAVIAAEAIKALIASGQVAPNDVAPQAISAAVAGPVSRGLWETKGDCAASQIKQAHRRQIERALPELTGGRSLRRAAAGPRAVLVQAISF